MGQVDPSLSFDQVGGLDHYIKALKEMVFLPLVYPELFERFHISPPRGVLFYGPPGAASGPSMLFRCLVSASVHELSPRIPVRLCHVLGHDTLLGCGRWIVSHCVPLYMLSCRHPATVTPYGHHILS